MWLLVGHCCFHLMPVWVGDPSSVSHYYAKFAYVWATTYFVTGSKVFGTPRKVHVM